MVPASWTSELTNRSVGSRCAKSHSGIGFPRHLFIKRSSTLCSPVLNLHRAIGIHRLRCSSPTRCCTTHHSAETPTLIAGCSASWWRFSEGLEQTSRYSLASLTDKPEFGVGRFYTELLHGKTGAIIIGIGRYFLGKIADLFEIAVVIANSCLPFSWQRTTPLTGSPRYRSGPSGRTVTASPSAWDSGTAYH